MGAPYSFSSQVLNASWCRGCKPLGRGRGGSHLQWVGGSKPMEGETDSHTPVWGPAFSFCCSPYKFYSQAYTPCLLSARPPARQLYTQMPHFPVCQALHLPSGRAFSRMVMALAVGYNGQLALEAELFLTSYRFLQQ